MKKVLFLGAPGFISTHSVNEAHKLGFDVAVFKRSPQLDSDLAFSPALYLGDRGSEDDLKKVLDDFRPDVAVDFACYQKRDAEIISKLLLGNVEQYIFVSSVDYYGYPLSELPYPEGGVSPIGHHTTEYAVEKGKCEDVFWALHREKGFPLTVARPFYSIHKRALVNLFSGRDWNHEGGRDLVERIRFGQPVISPGDGTTLFQAGCARNHGRMIAWLIGKASAVGESYNCSHDFVITIDDYMELIGRAVGRKPEIVHIPSEFLLSLGEKEVEDGYIPTMLQYNAYYSVEKFRRAFPDFRWECTLDGALREYMEWNEAQGLFRKKPRKTVEDRLIAMWKDGCGYMKSRL